MRGADGGPLEEESLFRRRMRGWGFVLPGEQLTDRESGLFSQLFAMSSVARFAPGVYVLRVNVSSSLAAAAGSVLLPHDVVPLRTSWQDLADVAAFEQVK